MYFPLQPGRYEKSVGYLKDILKSFEKRGKARELSLATFEIPAGMDQCPGRAGRCQESLMAGMPFPKVSEAQNCKWKTLRNCSRQTKLPLPCGELASMYDGQVI